MEKTANEMIQEAFEILVNHNLNLGEDNTHARLYAYAGMFGMLGTAISKSNAKTILATAKGWGK
jgi:hypothetical protein